MTKSELESIKPNISYVLFAEYPYRVASLRGLFIEIYDEEPHSLHTDLIKHESCKYLTEKEAKKYLSPNNKI